MAAQEGFNTKESRDSLLAEKGPQLEAACRGRGRHILRSLLRQIFAEKLSPPSPQDVAMPFGDVTFDVTFVPGSQGLAASTAHDAGKDEGAVTLNRYIVVFRATLRRPSEAQICGCWQGS